MLGPDKTVLFLSQNGEDVRKSRMKTLAATVEGAMMMCGLGVLVLGRAVQTLTTAKHNIKLVNRFLENNYRECAATTEGCNFSLDERSVFVCKY